MLWIPRSAPAEEASEDEVPEEGDVVAVDSDSVPGCEPLLKIVYQKMIFSH